MIMNSILISVVLPILMLVPPSAHAFEKWVDEKGVMHISDNPRTEQQSKNHEDNSPASRAVTAKPSERISMKPDFLVRITCNPKYNSFFMNFDIHSTVSENMWEIQNIKPSIHHMRFKLWNNMFWKIDTAKQRAFKITNGVFGNEGGTETLLENTSVMIFNQRADDINPPFGLQSTATILEYNRSTNEIIVYSEGAVISPPTDWQVVKVDTNNYNFRRTEPPIQTNRSHIFWNIDVNHMRIDRISSGSFGSVTTSGQLKQAEVPTGTQLKQAEMNNIALKRAFDYGEPDHKMLMRLLRTHNFQALEKEFENMLQQYKLDVQYESFLYGALNIFRSGEDLKAEDLDLWVEKSKSHISYTARGIYKEYRGFAANGTKFKNKTNSDQLARMQQLHKEAANDFQIAINKNPSMMPAYVGLMHIARTSGMTFTAKDIYQKAEEKDNRSYAVREEYMSSLQPRWGGSYEEMSAFAQHVIRFTNVNPRLWSLQGAADAERADSYFIERDFPSAIESITAALKFGDHIKWLQFRARCYEQLGKKDKSLADYEKIRSYDATK